MAAFACATAAALAILSASPAPGEARTTRDAAGAGPAACAGLGQSTAAPADGSPCWTDVTPYPFGSDGNAVAGSCVNPASTISCLTVTSFAFRAWNRGLAATRFAGGNTSTFGVWLWNGTRWFPDPTFPGGSTCPGNRILWAGKLDYWLVGQGSGWSSLCRFDGADFAWEPLKLPAATLLRVTKPDGTLRPGGITSGTCFSWDNCWFFGNLGTVVHWNGKQLGDQSPNVAAAPALGVEYSSAASATTADGQLAGIAVAGSSDNSGAPLVADPDTGTPAQLFVSQGTGWNPTAYTPPGAATDLAAVSIAPDANGWVVGDPDGWFFIAPGGLPGKGSGAVAGTSLPAPLDPVSTSGGRPGCTGPSGFTFTGNATNTAPAQYPPSYFWTSVGVDPTTGDALAGGEVRPGSSDALEPPAAGVYRPYEPVLVQADCSGTATVTRFRDETLTGANGPFVAADAVHAVALDASNDGWAATTYHVYRLTDGKPPNAAAGDDDETRPLQLQQDPPMVVFAAVPPPPPPPAPVVQSAPPPLPPAIDGVKTKLHVGTVVEGGVRTKTFSLDISFSVSRAVTIGAEALRKGRVGATTGRRSFVPPRGVLVR
jgi:hypothetical protein